MAVIDKVFNAQPSQYGIATVPGVATMGSCGLTASGANVSLDNCRIANLPVCTVGVDCPRIQVTVRHFGYGTAGNDTFQVTNSAFALAQNQGDANLDNNTSPSATAYFEARADVAVSKSDNPDPVPAGQLLTYTITASNPAATSGSAAYAVSISDTLPLDVVFLSATASGGGTCTTTPGANATTTPANRTLVCGWPSIARGGQQTVTVKVRVLASNSVVGGGSGSVSNSVTVSTTTPEIAGGGANNSATQATTVTSPVYDLLVNKTDDAEPGIASTLTLTGTDNWGQPVNLSVTSDASTGAFAFNVPPGTYTLTQTQPAGFDGGITRAGAVSGAGSAPGSVPTSGPGVTSGPNGSNANTIQTIVLGSGGTSSDNLFGEVQRASLAGRVYQAVGINWRKFDTVQRSAGKRQYEPSSKRITRSGGGGEPTIQPSLAGSLACASGKRGAVPAESGAARTSCTHSSNNKTTSRWA